MPEVETSSPGEVSTDSAAIKQGEPVQAEIKSVSQEDFDKFQKQVTDTLTLVAENIANLAKTKEKPAEKVEDEGGPAPDQSTPVPPAWQKAVHEILGIDFECELKQPDHGGTIFTVIVPKNKSNASQLHWQNFKSDRRSKELGNSGLDGVKAWCLKVRANLIAANKKLVQYP